MGEVVLGVAGLRSACQRRWGMGLKRSFDLIDGWGQFLCVCVSVGCLSYMKTSPLRWQLCFLLVWSRDGMRGCGGGDCGLGRRRC